MRKVRSLSFGQVIAKRRSELGYQLKEVASKIRKEGGQPISLQYLSDIERDRRYAPSDHLIDELARELDISRSFLYLVARRLPSDYTPPADEQIAKAAYEALCKATKSGVAA
jgi:transcriptional regulator with XRE-family HTH domain